jgi:hypothetical protein
VWAKLDPRVNVSAVLFCSRYLESCGKHDLVIAPQVQSGGDFDIDFEVKDPVNEQILDGQVWHSILA